MLYQLLSGLAGEVSALNVFRYITFRTGGAIVTALLFVMLFGPSLISLLRLKQGKGQPIRSDGPQRHIVEKQGTPTMGGLMILAGILAGTLLWADLTNLYVWAVLSVTLGFGAIGFYDDYLKVTRRQSDGFSGRVRLLIEFAIAAAAALLFMELGSPQLSSALALPFLKDVLIQLGWLFVPLTALVIVGAGNAVNLTDGLDGLAIVPVIIAAASFGVIVYLRRQCRLCGISAAALCPGIGRARGPVRRHHRRRPRLSVVQCAPGYDLHGRYRLAVAGRGARRHRGCRQA